MIDSLVSLTKINYYRELTYHAISHVTAHLTSRVPLLICAP